MSNEDILNDAGTESNVKGLDEMLDLDAAKVAEELKAKSPVKPRFVNNAAPKPAVPPPASKMVDQPQATDFNFKSDDEVSEAQLRAAERALQNLLRQQGINLKPGESTTPVNKKIDWSKVTETDATNLDFTMDAIDLEMPDYMGVTLKDPNYTPRWVNRHPRRLGPMKARGWSYVTKDELAEELKIDLEPDENGVYRTDDVVLMKCEKSQYYGLIRRNYLRSVAMINPKAAHKVAKSKVDANMREFSRDYDRVIAENKMSVFSPMLGDRE